MKYLYSISLILLLAAPGFAEPPGSIEYSFSLDHSYPVGSFASQADYGSGATFSLRSQADRAVSVTSSVSYHHWNGLPHSSFAGDVASMPAEYHSVRLTTGARYRLGSGYLGLEAGFLDMSAVSKGAHSPGLSATLGRTVTAWGLAPVAGFRAQYDGIWVEVAGRYCHFGPYRFAELRVGLLVNPS